MAAAAAADTAVVAEVEGVAAVVADADATDINSPRNGSNMDRFGSRALAV